MKLQTNYEKVQSHGATDVADFSVALNAKTFKALSDTLYMDKIGSIVRELASNAVDAHRAAGNSNPYEIHLPDNFEPYFSIRDFGTGISPDDIVSVYCKYFESTKDNTNDDIGAFGLGAKTPFCYTDSYTITSIYKGIKRVYNAYINDGIPKIIQFGDDEQTDEHNGLEVSISVRTEDFNEFKKAVVKQLKFFNDKPTIFNGSIQWPEFDKINEIDNFIQYEHVNFSGYSDRISGTYIVQGGVGYPVDFNHIISYADKIDAPKNIIKFLKFLNAAANNINCIEMPIGSVSVTISRESLSYEETTIKNIYECVKTVTSNIADKVFQNLDTAYKNSYMEFSKTFNNLDKFFTDILDNNTLESKYKKFKFDESRSGLICKYPLPEKMEEMVLKTYGFQTKNRVFGLENQRHFKNELKYTTLDNFPTLVYIQDVKSYPAKRMEESEGSHLLYVPSGVTIKNLKKIFTNTEFRNISDIEYTPSRENNGGGRTKQTDKRNFFYVSEKTIKTLLKPYNEFSNITLFKLGAQEEFEIDFEDFTMPCAYFVTERNKMDLSLYADVPLVAFVDYIKNAHGYEIIAIPKNDVKRANKNGLIPFDEIWNKQKNNFIDSVEQNIEKGILTQYYNLAHTNGFKSKITHFYSMFNSCKITPSIDLDNVIDIIDNEAKTFDFKNYNLFKNLFNDKTCKMLDEYENIYSNGTIDMENLLKKFNIVPKFKYTKIFNSIMQDIKDNIDRISIYYLSDNGYVNIDQWDVHDNGRSYNYTNTKKLFDADEIKIFLEKKMENWS